VLCVACFYWEDDHRAATRSVKLTAEDVRIWDSMVGRNLTIPHKRICVTHRPDKIDFMETMPLDVAKHVPGTCLVKLQAHKPGGVAKEGDRVLLMDIDCVVTGNLDPLVETDAPAKWWRNPNHDPNTPDGRKRGYVQGSLQLFTVGATEFLWRDFDPKTSMAWINRRFGGAEQCWISERLNAAYPDAGWEWSIPHFTDADGVYGRGRLFNGKMGAGVQTELPSNARIVFFPGNRSPSEPEAQAESPWIKEFYR